MSRGIDHVSLCELSHRNDQILGGGGHGSLLGGCGPTFCHSGLLGEDLAAVGGYLGRGLRGERNVAGVLGGC